MQDRRLTALDEYATVESMPRLRVPGAHRLLTLFAAIVVPAVLWLVAGASARAGAVPPIPAPAPAVAPVDTPAPIPPTSPTTPTSPGT
jgi:hypothetical protein